jgi:hypothetical protein
MSSLLQPWGMGNCSITRRRYWIGVQKMDETRRDDFDHYGKRTDFLQRTKAPQCRYRLDTVGDSGMTTEGLGDDD